jgi:hypothetical protein
MTVDTLAYAKELQAAGVPVEAAEAHAVALNRALQTGVATKADITGLRAEMLAMEERIYGRMASYLVVQGLSIVAVTAAVVAAIVSVLK